MLDENRVKGIIIGGDIENILIRKKKDRDIEVGELLFASFGNKKIILQVFKLIYSSQISKQNLELLSGLRLENEDEFELYDENLRLYEIAIAKPLLTIYDNKVFSPKELPTLFSNVCEVTKDELSELNFDTNGLFLGSMRSGRKKIDLDIYLDAQKCLSHHILISAQTGKGKSNLNKVLLSSTLNLPDVSVVIFDAHDEYYGNNIDFGLSHINNSKKLVYYSKNNESNQNYSLLINFSSIKPHHILNVLELTEPQKDFIYLLYKRYHSNWIDKLLSYGKEEQFEGVNEMTAQVSKRRILTLLDIDSQTNETRGIFSRNSGINTIENILTHIKDSKTIIIDTSRLTDKQEILIASIIASEVFNRYKSYKLSEKLHLEPVVSFVLEEAPRVIGKDAITKGNIFGTIAREGRKFKIGLVAITQLPSLIPREILANINTKIILGIEMKQERESIISSSSQDLSKDDDTIKSLDTGEAIVSSAFTKFAIPLKIPYFKEYVEKLNSNNKKYQHITPDNDFL